MSEKLTKDALVEVQGIVSKANLDLKSDVDKRLDRMEKSNNKRWEEMNEFKRVMYETLDKIDRAVLGLEFQHSWKTAMWVCVGSALPTAAGVAFFLLKS